MKIISSEQRLVKYLGNEISYTLLRKKVKNINLRVKSDRSVVVSANAKVSAKQIDDFVVRKSQDILTYLEKFKEIEKTPLVYQYISGEDFYLLGKKLKLKVEETKSESVTIDENYICLNVKDQSDISKKQKLIEKFFNTQCEKCFSELMEKTQVTFSVYNIKMPLLKMRTMKSRWGSCMPSKKIITLNKKLIHLDYKYIEYVVVHEFVHLIHPNHSKNFYNFLAGIIPNWKQLRQELNEKGRGVL